MKKERNGITWLLIGYSLLMLLIMACTVFLMAKRITRIVPKETITETEKYIYVYQEPISNESEPLPEEVSWIVKEHEKRIGVFSQEGVLLEVVEVYTNTLPQTDQKLLREGIVVSTKADLYALIEDYSE